MDDLAVQALPYVLATIAAFGRNVVTRLQTSAEDQATDAAVNLGGRLLRRLLGQKFSAPAIEGAVDDVAANPGDPDYEIALRAQLRTALTQDEGLRRDIAALIGQATTTITASGNRSVAAHTISGTVITGDGPEVRT